MRTVLAGLVLVLATVAPALANPSSKPSTGTVSDDCARARAANKTCVLSIEEEAVDGSVPRSGETSLAIAQFTHASSLISLRRDFIPEIVKTAEDL